MRRKLRRANCSAMIVIGVRCPYKHNCSLSFTKIISNIFDFSLLFFFFAYEQKQRHISRQIAFPIDVSYRLQRISTDRHASCVHKWYLFVCFFVWVLFEKLIKHFLPFCIKKVLPISKHTIKYGSDDGGRTVHTDIEELNQIMKVVGERLNLKGHAGEWLEQNMFDVKWTCLITLLCSFFLRSSSHFFSASWSWKTTFYLWRWWCWRSSWHGWDRKNGVYFFLKWWDFFREI